MNSKDKTIIFTDGSSRGNPGPGGWGVVIVSSGNIQELGGGEADTTNNRMELIAAVQGLINAPIKPDITVFTDSAYVINGITKWVHGWKNNGWKTKTKDDVLNKDLWVKLDSYTGGRKIEWKRIGGHVGILGNERCDHIATAFADGRKIKLYDGPLANYDLPKILDISFDELKQTKKKSSSSHSRAKAHSYVSSVGGVIKVHYSWAECEKRVKGAKGARYKKAVSAGDQRSIMQEFGTL